MWLIFDGLLVRAGGFWHNMCGVQSHGKANGFSFRSK